MANMQEADDQSERLGSTAAPSLTERTFEATFEVSQAGLALVDLDGRFLRTNAAWATITGYQPADLEGRTFAVITDPDDLAADEALVDELLAGHRDYYRIEKRYLHRSGGVVWVDLRVAMVREADGSPVHLVATITDISERKHVEDSLRSENRTLAHRATHDHLTGLPNRALLDEHLRHGLARAERGGETTWLLVADLDRFKAVNDRWGHITGDVVLITVAHRLRGVCRDSDVVARLGGDEFAIIIDRVSSAESVHRLTTRLHDAVRRPMEAGGVTVQVGVSIGVAALRGEDGDPAGIISRADSAAYLAKQRGGGLVFVDSGPGFDVVRTGHGSGTDDDPGTGDTITGDSGSSQGPIP